MKKVYLSLGAFLSFVLMSVLPAQAQVESMVDLYGTYKFTSKMEVTEAGQAYAESFAAESDVVITKDDGPNGWDAVISGLAGSTKATHNVYGMDLAEKKFNIQNWAATTAWADGVYMSDAEGIYPFGWGDMPQLGKLYFTYDSATLNITIPDFTLVTVDNVNATATVLAKFTECKLTHISSEKIDIVDISGEWHAKAMGNYGSNSESEVPAEYDFVLTKVSEETKKHHYTMDLSIEGFNTLTLNATFDGNKLNVPLDSVVFDAEKGILAVNMNSGNPYTSFGYTFSSENTLSMDAVLCLAQYVADVDSTGSPITRLEYVQWWMNGNAKKEISDDEKFDWAGTWNVVVGSPESNIVVFDGYDRAEFPSEFKMVVTYYEDYDLYLVTEFLGNDVSRLNNGGIAFTPSEDDPNVATLAVDKYLATIVAGETYYKLYDGIGSTNSSIKLTVLDDGSVKIGDFFVEKINFNDNTTEHAAYYGFDITATKQIVEPFDFVGTYTVKATPEQVLTDYEYPSEFAMEIQFSEYTEKYYVTTFLGNNIYQMTQGGIPCEREGNTLKVAVGDTRYVRKVGNNDDYTQMWYDTLGETEGGENGYITLTVNEDGTISLDDFCIYRTTITYDSNWNATKTSELACRYTNSSVTTGATGIEDVIATPANVKGIYTLFGVRVGDDASDLESLPSGIYIVNDGVKSIKVAR